MNPFMKISVLGAVISSDTDPAVPRQIAKYTNAVFKDAKADNFELVELEHISNAMQPNRQQRAEGRKTSLAKEVKKSWKIDVEVDSSSYRMSCNLALRAPRNTDCLSTAGC